MLRLQPAPSPEAVSWDAEVSLLQAPSSVSCAALTRMHQQRTDLKLAAALPLLLPLLCCRSASLRAWSGRWSGTLST